MKNIITFLSTIIFISGCSTLESRVVEHQKTCEVMGFKKQTTEMANCVLKLETERLRRANDQANAIINQAHGAGGCTPNHSTGGCLD